MGYRGSHSNIVPEAAVATALSLYVMFANFLIAVGPVIIGQIIDHSPTRRKGYYYV